MKFQAVLDAGSGTLGVEVRPRSGFESVPCQPQLVSIDQASTFPPDDSDCSRDRGHCFP